MYRLLSIGVFALTAGVACRGADTGGVVNVNREPIILITEPAEGAEYDFGEPIEFVALVTDDGPLTQITRADWSSDLTGVLHDSLGEIDPDGNITFTTSNMQSGTHTVTLQVVDGNGAPAAESVTVTIINVPDEPTISVIHPAGGENGAENQPYRFEVVVDDGQDDPRDLTTVLEEDEDDDGAYETWICDLPADSDGNAFCDAELSFGTHKLRFTTTDLEAFTTTRLVNFDVVSELDHDGDGDGFTDNEGDCNDNNATVYPGAPEICDTLDNDCNDTTPIDVGTECYDDDGDGYCEAAVCTDGAAPGDCDDTVPQGAAIHPGASEMPAGFPDGVDNDCNGLIDDGTPKWDDDLDGYCEQPPCVNASGTLPDCNDNDYTVNPAALETCDGVDNDCDSITDPKDSNGCQPYYRDNDGDGFGGSGPTECHCPGGGGDYTASNDDDCFDNNANAYPHSGGSYYDLHRGDGSYDYNCDFNEQKQYTSIHGGCVKDFEIFGIAWCSNASGSGWAFGGDPGCGNTGFWASDCDAALNLSCAACAFAADPGACLATCGGSGSACAPEGSSRTQACR